VISQTWSTGVRYCAAAANDTKTSTFFPQFKWIHATGLFETKKAVSITTFPLQNPKNTEFDRAHAFYTPFVKKQHRTKNGQTITNFLPSKE
jgi:hypothetical protein